MAMKPRGAGTDGDDAVGGAHLTGDGVDSVGDVEEREAEEGCGGGVVVRGGVGGEGRGCMCW